jgi:hypothetical protein
MTASFVGAAELMARALGAEGYPLVVVEHPISSASAQDLAGRARKAAAECAELLCAPTSG